MFAYCLNNPLYFSDNSGELAYPGEIHNAVVRHLKDMYKLFYEQKIIYSKPYKGRYSGRADLISTDGQVWDVKRDRPWHIAEGADQVRNYVANTWKNKPSSQLSVGGYIASGEFPYKSGIITYKVTYRYAGEGVIAYDYVPVDIDLKPILHSLQIVCTAAGAGALCGFAETLFKSPVNKCLQ